MNWMIQDRGFSSENIDYFGNKYLIGNGYCGVRGSLDEYVAAQRPSINLAGVYDQCAPGKWRESVNAPNGLYLSLAVNGTTYALPDRQPLEHTQWLDMYKGIHGRKTVWEVDAGQLTVESERFASMADPHRLMVRYTVSATAPCHVTLHSGIDADIWDINGPHFAAMALSVKDGGLQAVGTTCEQGITVSVTEQVETDLAAADVTTTDSRICRAYEGDLTPGNTYTLIKTVYIQTSKDEGYPLAPAAITYEEAKAAHTARWATIWDRSAVTIEGDEDAMLALNYSIYHLNCIAPRHSGSMSIPARGLSGQVYKGAIFWDTEMFMFDYFLFTDPAVARTFLQYRIDTLPGAKDKAASYDYAGAFYAWESHEGGFDACTDYNITDVFTGRPTRTYFRDKQVHVSAAMVYALNRYLTVTGDTGVLQTGGAEMLIECALFYESLLLKRANKDRYEIHDVVGPDEYHERVNNNAYTNRMAKFTLETAVRYLTVLQEEGTTACLGGRYDIDALIARFAEEAGRVFVPAPHPETGLIEQFDGYFKLEDASVAEVRSRLLDEREYWGGANGVASHTQVNKQADTVAMLGMFPEEYTRDVMAANFHYYEPRTEHGSSLSACMYALLACYTGQPEKAYPLFMKSAQQDLLPASKLWLGLIFIGGTHPAAAGGAWMVASRGFAGVQIRDGVPCADAPALPATWQKLSFKMNCRGKWYAITATQTETTVEEI